MSKLNSRRRWLGTLLLAGAMMASAAAPAHADMRCEWEWIVINSGRGAEEPMRAAGHRHRTGNHYVGYIDEYGRWHWFADHDGGLDGDTDDTYYGVKDC